jgi:hypothetical protein
MTAELEQYEKQHDPLPALRQQLAKEFEGIVPRDRIDEAAERAIGDFKGAPVRAFVPILAWRRARASLTADPDASVGAHLDLDRAEWSQAGEVRVDLV